MKVCITCHRNNRRFADMIFYGETCSYCYLPESVKEKVKKPLRYCKRGCGNTLRPKARVCDSELWIWEYPQEGHQYIMGVDVSRGDGEDSSTITVVDFTTMEQVMEYQGKIQPDLLAQIVEEYGELYKAYTVVGVTGGMGVLLILEMKK